MEEFFPLGPLRSDSQSFLRLNGVFFMRKNGLVELMRPAKWMEYPQALLKSLLKSLSAQARKVWGIRMASKETSLSTLELQKSLHEDHRGASEPKRSSRNARQPSCSRAA